MNSASARKRAVLAAVAALLSGLLLRVFFIVLYPRIAGDPMVYMDYARTLLEHHLYGYTRIVNGISHSYPSLVRLPGYPFFLAACFAVFGHANVSAALFLQALIDLTTCVLAALTAARFFGARAGWFALWLGVLCPFTATYVAAALTETLVLFTIALAFYALIRWVSGSDGWLYVVGVALAYSILLRPDQGLLAVAIVPAVLWLSPGRGAARFRPAALVSVLTLLPLLVWTARNERTFHVFQPLVPRSAANPGELVTEGFNRWYRTWGIDFATNETVYWAYNSDPIQPGDLPGRAFDSSQQRTDTAALLNQYNLTTTETPEFDARFAALADQRIRGHRFRYDVLLPTARTLDMLFRPRTELLPVYDDWWKPQEDWAATLAWAGTYFVLNLAYFLLAALGALRSRMLLTDGRLGEPVLWAMLATVFLRLALLATLDNAEPRYTLEFFPIVFILAGAWLANLKTRQRETRN